MTGTVSSAVGDGGHMERPELGIVVRKDRETKEDGRYIIFYTFGNTSDKDAAREEG